MGRVRTWLDSWGRGRRLQKRINSHRGILHPFFQQAFPFEREGIRGRWEDPVGFDRKEMDEAIQTKPNEKRARTMDAKQGSRRGT